MNELYMQRCFELALRGLGTVSSNPLVGAVLVAEGRIIGEGWHKNYGEAHAEVNAVHAVAEEDKHLLETGTLFVNLEPCNHQGKTPPCVDLILANKIPNVIICNLDPFPLVAGKGIERLRENGVNVVTGILEKEGLWLNRRFFTAQEKNRPYVILKYAQSEDGFFAKDNQSQTWISHPQVSRITHKWRAEEDAILVGTTTAKIDNPQLNVRHFPTKKQPIRLVIDRDLSIPNTHHLFDQTQETIVFTEHEKENKNHLQYCHFDFNNKLITNILQHLIKLKVGSLIVEGGAQTLQQFIDQNLWDEARIITGNQQIKQGISAPLVHGKQIEELTIADNKISIIQNQNACSLLS